MFDFAFSEIALIGVVALVVIGPERLPRVARTAGVVLGRVQRYAAAVRADIAREVELSELRRVQGELSDAARSFETGVRDSLASAEQHFDAGRQALMTATPHPDVPAHAEPPVAGAVGPAPAAAAAEASPPPQPSLFAPEELPPGDSATPPADHA